jgi:hypothetical protein
VLTNYGVFYLGSQPKMIPFQNFQLINYQGYKKLLNQGCLEYTNQLFIINLLGLVENKPPLFIDNQIHLIYDPKHQATIKEREHFIKMQIEYHQIDRCLNFFPHINCIISSISITDKMNTLLSKLIWQYYPFIGNFGTDTFEIPESCLKEFSESINFKPNLELKNDFLPECQSFEPNKHTIITSLINIVSFTIIDLIEAANFIKKIGVNFALSPDLECLAITPKNFDTLSKILKNNVLQLIPQERIGELLDLRLTAYHQSRERND